MNVKVDEYKNFRDKILYQNPKGFYKIGTEIWGFEDMGNGYILLMYKRYRNLSHSKKEILRRIGVGELNRKVYWCINSIDVDKGVNIKDYVRESADERGPGGKKIVKLNIDVNKKP